MSANMSSVSMSLLHPVSMSDLWPLTGHCLMSSTANLTVMAVPQDGDTHKVLVCHLLVEVDGWLVPPPSQSEGCGFESGPGTFLCDGSPSSLPQSKNSLVGWIGNSTVLTCVCEYGWLFVCCLNVALPRTSISCRLSPCLLPGRGSKWPPQPRVQG